MYSKIAGKVQELMHGAKSLCVSCTGTSVGVVVHLEKGHLNPQSCIDLFDFLSSKNECFFLIFSCQIWVDFEVRFCMNSN